VSEPSEGLVRSPNARPWRLYLGCEKANRHLHLMSDDNTILTIHRHPSRVGTGKCTEWGSDKLVSGRHHIAPAYSPRRPDAPVSLIVNSMGSYITDIAVVSVEGLDRWSVRSR
jgi:hypothetical protein